ncbi:MAG: galactokinase [Proteobacteria bacterium]|nr:galactokinase [Pseudomonadota bacterium]
MSSSSRIAKALATNSRLFRAPGRVNIIGEHTDYNDGLVLPTNTALYTWLNISPRSDRTIHVTAHNLGDSQSFCLDDIRRSENPGWLDYIKGVAAQLEADGVRLRGAELSIDGEIPIGGGLSSSASLELATATALLKISAAEMAPERISEICQQAENLYAGVNCGIMDQYSVACCKRGEAILLDCRSLDTMFVTIPKHISLLITDSGAKHRLPDGAYNNRGDECRQAVDLIAEVELGIQSLRDVSMPTLQASKVHLGERLFRRSRHVVTEIIRVTEAFGALQSGDPVKLGALVSASHSSLRDDFEVSCDEVENLVEIADACDGVLGSRMIGGGFGGCVLSVTYTERLEDTISKISNDYGPIIGRTPWMHIVSPTDPAGEVDMQ